MSTGPDLRPRRQTPNLGLPVPGDADAADAPTDIGNLADAIDDLAIAGGFGLQSGDIKMSARTTTPDGWLLCDGRVVSRLVFADLFRAIGVAYGAGDGSTTFAIPDYRNVFPLGASSAGATGVRGGAAAHTLSAEEMPYHQHGVYDNTHSHAIWTGDHGHGDPGHSHWMGSLDRWNSGMVNTGGVNMRVPGAGGSGTDASGTGLHGAGNLGGGAHASWAGISATDFRGAGWSHNNMPPYAAVNFFIKT